MPPSSLALSRLFGAGRRRVPRWHPIAAIAGAVVLALTAGCDRFAGRQPSGDPDSGFRGIVISPPRPKPDFTLTDTEGRPFDFRRETAGKVTLLFFGYTHCPDVCPLHVANVAAVLSRMPFEEREAIRFVFVTTDPKRDTPERLKSWLANFDPGFVGLTGDEEEVNRILYELRMPPIQADPQPVDSARYLVGHAAQVLAFSTDGMARLEYPFGIRQEDWARDLPKLARGEVPLEPPPGDGALTPGEVELRALAENAAQAAARGMPIRVRTAIVPRPASQGEAALYLVLENGGTDDTLTGVMSDISQRAEIHETVADGAHAGMRHMQQVQSLVVKDGETLRLVPGERHVMLLALSRIPAVGETITVRLQFAGAGDVVVGAEVVDYASVEARLR